MGFYERAVAAQAHALAPPFDVVAHEGEEPDGGLEEVFERGQPEGERVAWCVLRGA